jgi:hypothetical protein
MHETRAVESCCDGDGPKSVDSDKYCSEMMNLSWTDVDVPLESDSNSGISSETDPFDASSSEPSRFTVAASVSSRFVCCTIAGAT